MFSNFPHFQIHRIIFTVNWIPKKEFSLKCVLFLSLNYLANIVLHQGSEGEIDRRKTGGDGLTTDMGKVAAANDDKFDGLMNSTQLQLMKDNNKRLIGIVVLNKLLFLCLYIK